MNNFKIIANWKMNGTNQEVERRIHFFKDKVEDKNQSDCFFCHNVCYINNANEIIYSYKISLN